ncbi:MAG: YcgN family cysteine cluster protein [Pseudomonadota bacterium]|nr:YcgN family cysteine cluster protein [Pseudomonadota bacterium]|tara:strand:- start:448 stop:909 length:462 start_codon:yes stop_codon:yes gene_type:complete
MLESNVVKSSQPPFWQTKSLDEMSKTEWESLCDGCGKCCLNKLEDEKNGDVQYTSVACRLLDTELCRCTSYDERKRFVPDCQILNPRLVRKLRWLPSTCAYRLIEEGKDLYWWHPLISNNKESVHKAYASVRGRVVSERETDNLEGYIVDWPK